MKIAYIDFSQDRKEELAANGIERKKQAQVEALTTLGPVDRHAYNIHDQSKLTLITRKITKRLPFFPSMMRFHYDASYDGVSVLYYRRDLIDSYTIKFLSEFRRNNPTSKILFEIPTYPYDGELTSFRDYPVLLKERWNRRKLPRYVDRIVTLSDDGEIFGIPTIKIRNGIDFLKTPMRKISHEEDGVIHAIMIAKFAPWHGLDRVIEGMKAYKQHQESRPFILHVVGEGAVVNSARKEVSSSGLHNFVVFHGKIPFTEQDEIYNSVSLALDSFGGHRKKLIVSGSIKSREYGAKGLPMVSSTKIDYIPEDSSYFLLIPSDESPVDIMRVINFHDSIYKTKSDYDRVAKEIRLHAENNCSVSSMMEPIIRYAHETEYDDTKRIRI